MTVTIYITVLLKCMTYGKQTDTVRSVPGAWKQKQNGGGRLQCLGGEVRVTPDALAIVFVCMS